MENQSVESPLNLQNHRMGWCKEVAPLALEWVRERTQLLAFLAQQHLVDQCAEVGEDVRTLD